MIVAVDFDETLSFGEYPEVKLFFPAINVLRRAKKNGHKIILWTCRHDEALEKAVKACQEVGLEFDAVNENDPEQAAEWIARTGDVRFSPKVYADCYIDEKAYPRGQVNWREWDAKLNGVYPSIWEKFKTVFILGGIGFIGGWLTATFLR